MPAKDAASTLDEPAAIASIDTRDSTVIGMCLPAPLADNGTFPLNEPVRLATDDPEAIEALGAGLARDTVNQIMSKGIRAHP